MQVVDGNEHTVSLSMPSNTLGLRAAGTFTVAVKNTGLLGDRFTLDLLGLDPTWYEFETDEVALSPGGTAEIALQVQIEDCGQSGVYPFTVRATSAATGGVQTAEGTLTLQAEPVISALQPKDGLELGARDVAVSWHTDAQTTGILTIYPFGQPEDSQVFNTPEGLDHSLVVEGLTRDMTYMWQVEAASACGAGLSPERQFTVTNGVVFTDHSIDVMIDRDYDQRFSVTIVNTDIVAHTDP
jgi:hypothetical protein